MSMSQEDKNAMQQAETYLSKMQIYNIQPKIDNHMIIVVTV